MTHNGLPRWLGLSWPWLFARSAVWTGWYLAERIVLRQSAAMFSFGHVLWFIAAPCLLALIGAHLWMLGVTVFAVTRKATFPLFRFLLLAVAILPAYVPEWLWEMLSR